MRSQLTLLSAALCAGAVFGQQTTPVFSSSTFYHVEDAQRQAYLDFTKNQSRKLYEALVRENQAIRRILVSEITYGGNPEPRANFVLSVISEGPPTPPASFDPVVRKTLGMSYDEYAHKARALRTRVGQVLSQNLATEGTEPIREGDLVRIDYMKIAEGRAADYYNMERNDYRPLHALRIKDGGMKRWSLFAVRLPIGENRTYDAYTAQVFQDMAGALAAARYGELARKAAPEKNLAAMSERGRTTRKLVRGELRRIVVAVSR